MVQQRAVWGLFLLLVGCGADPGGVAVAQQALEGGSPCGGHQFGETGALLGKASWPGTSVCTGTLIAANAVLTAAHCIDPNSPLEPLFVLDPHATRAGAHSAFAIRQAVVHPAYRVPLLLGRKPETDGERAALAALARTCGMADGDLPAAQWRACVVSHLSQDVQRSLGMVLDLTERHDLAIVWLQEPVVGATLAALPEENDTPTRGMALDVVGYGVHGAAGLLNPATGERYWGRTWVAQVGNFELASSGGPARACAGDSGAPAFAVDPLGGPRRLVAVASQATYNAQGACAGPSIFQRVDVHVPWILRTLRRGGQ